MSRYVTLEQATERVLLDSMPESLKAALDAALAGGATKAAIIRHSRRVAGGRNITVLSVEVYLKRHLEHRR